MNPSCRVFDQYATDYDRWFDDHSEVYTQLQMLIAAVPDRGCTLEIGVGSGRFAVPLGIQWGIDPLRPLIRIAKSRGVEVILGEGEHLPYRERSFDSVLMMTVICFLDEPLVVFREVLRVLVTGGKIIVGFIEKNGEIARQYRHEETKRRFLQYAHFQSVDEVGRYFDEAGFSEVSVIRRVRGFCVMNGKKK
jgi:SAM-dependent methyltransferase